MLYEVIEWAEQLSQSVENQTRAKSVSDIILILYVIAYMINKKGCFIVAFLLCEIAGVTYNLQTVDGYKLFLVYTSIYSILTLYVYKTSGNSKTFLYCAIMTLFDGALTVDSIYYCEVETFLYIVYVPVVLLIHVLIIFSLFKWRYDWRGLADTVRAFVSQFSISYNAMYFWYTVKNTLHKESR